MAESNPNLQGEKRDAYKAILNQFKQYGLESLASKILEFVQEGYSPDTVAILLQDTKEWKQRFKGNEIRLKAGLPVLSPAEYIATERGYAQAMAAAGMPKGFYDDVEDFAGMIGRDTSVAEVQSRVAGYVAVAKQADSAYRAMLRDTFGIGLTDGDLAAYLLDSKRALPLLERQVQSIGIADAARRQGLGYSAERSDRLAELGVTADQANQAFGTIAEVSRDFGRTGAAYGVDYTQQDAEDEVLLQSESAKRKRKKVENTFKAYTPESQSRAAKGAFGPDTTGSY